MIPVKNGLYVVIAWLICSTIALSQERISQQISSRNFKFELRKTLFSVNVKDEKKFQTTYKDKITIQYKHNHSNCYVIQINHRDALAQLKLDQNILFIDSHRTPKAEGEFDFVNASFNRITKVQSLLQGLDGSSQKISIKEQSFDPTSIDLINRSFTTSVSPSTISQHATTMATLIAGGGNSSYHALGVASSASITSSDFNNLFPDDETVFATNNIHVQNHSYGVAIENYYGNEAQAYDQQVLRNPGLLHVFSVGNSGQSSPPSGLYQGLSFATLTGNFKQAKNVLVINAVDTTLSINALNSRGPAFDGRVKPELTAYGQGGTSEATALVSGIASLVQEKYFELNSNFPDAALVKAILIASADDIGPTGIDFLYGYGNVNAYKAVHLVELGNYREVTLTSNDAITLPINVPSSVATLKISVAWSDAAAEVNAGHALVNDIDSWLDEGTQNIYPWVLSSYPHADSLMASAKRKGDHLNNVEYITVDNPSAGIYQLHLKSNTLNTADQKISIAYWFDKQEKFAWDFPLASDKVEAGKKNLLVWDPAKGQHGDLYVQINQGAWSLLKSNLNLDQYLYWKSPDTLANANLKMVIGTEEFISESFQISPVLEIKTAFNCADSIGLVWNSFKGVDHYDVYTMGASYLQEKASVTDTLIVLPKTGDQYFSVAPVMQTAAGLKSETIDYGQQGSFCFLNLFSAIRFTADQVKVQLTLSSWHEVDHINIYQTSNDGRQSLATQYPGSRLSFEWLDSNLVPGILIYQAEIIFKNSQIILSDQIEIPIEAKGKAILYPNPVTSDSDLKIISQGGGVKFRILDVFGRIIFETNLEVVESSIDVLNLTPGFYLYQILTADEITDTGKLVRQ